MRDGSCRMLHGDASDAVEQGGDATLVGDDYGSAGGGGFGGGVAEIFVLRGEDEEVGVAVREPFGVAGERAGETDAGGDVKLRRHLLKAGEHAGLVGADEGEMRGGRERGELREGL